MKIKNHPNKGTPFHPQNVRSNFKTEALTYNEHYIKWITEKSNSSLLTVKDIEILSKKINSKVKPLFSINANFFISYWVMNIVIYPIEGKA